MEGGRSEVAQLGCPSHIVQALANNIMAIRQFIRFKLLGVFSHQCALCWLHQLVPTEQSFYFLHSVFNCAAAIRTHYWGPLVLLFHCFQFYTSGNSRTDAKELLAWSCDSWLVDLVSDVYFCLNGIPGSSKNNLHMPIFLFSTTL